MMGTIVKRTPRQWDVFFMGLAQLTAKMSKDPDRKVGAVVVSADRRQLSIGYNGLPACVPDDLDVLTDRARKLELMVHAEENCIRQAPFGLAGSTLYVTRFPCEHCATKIVTAGITRLVAPRPDFNHGRWGPSWHEANRHLYLHGVTVIALGTLRD